MQDPEPKRRQRNYEYRYRGKYRALHQYLKRMHDQTPRNQGITLTFDEIERLLGFPLPPEARRRRAWWRVHEWANEHTRRCQCNAWASLSLRPMELNLRSQRVTFGFFVY
jgi:hypothetical protein